MGHTGPVTGSLYLTVGWASQNGRLFTRSTTEFVVSTADVDTVDRFHDLIRIIATGCPNLENEMILPEKEGNTFIRNVGYLPS